MKKQGKILNAILSHSEKGKLYIKINTLENENDSLKCIIKDELYKTFMAKLNEPLEVERLRKDNKNLRKKIKLLKELVKEGADKGGKRR